MSIINFDKKNSKEPSVSLAAKSLRFAAFVGTIFFVKFFYSIFILPISASISIHAKRIFGTEWNAAHAELTAKYKSQMPTYLDGARVSDAIIDELVSCYVDKFINLANSSSCPYLYNKTNTSKWEHMRSQDVCMRAIPNYNAQVQEFLFQCKKSIIPNDWQIFRYIYTEEYETSFVKKKYSKDDAHKLSLCISKKIVDAFNKSGCKLINKKSSKSENLFNLDCLSNGSVDINNLEKQFTEECLASFN